MSELNILKMSSSIGKIPELKGDLKLDVDMNTGFSELMESINEWNEKFNRECSRMEIEAVSGRLEY